MNRPHLALLSLAALLSSAAATQLRLYPGFTEVRQAISSSDPAVTFSFNQWRWIQPGSFAVNGPVSASFSVRPAELDWLHAQEGQSVTWLPAGRPPVPATLARADDLLLKLGSGSYVNAQRRDLAFSTKPPSLGGVTVRLRGAAPKNAELSYRTQALSWTPRYELNLSGAASSLAALAQIRNLSDEVFSGQTAELYAGSVQQQFQPTPAPVANSEQGARTAGIVAQSMTGASNIALDSVQALGEVRGLQRYALPGGLTVGRGESLSLPFLSPKVSAFSRYASVQSYFDGQNRSGRTNRHYKFTASPSLPTGLIDVRESGLLVGSVQLGVVQAGKVVDLDLGADAELRYEKTVKRTGQAKDAKGRVLSTTSQVTYTFVSTKSGAVSVSVREQLYARSVSIDAQAPQNGQVTLSRQVTVPAGGQASLSFSVKIMN